MPSSDPCQERRLEQERQKREKYLQRKVQETLSLAAPEQPNAEKICAHGTCSLTSEELKAQSRQYKRKLRTNRILQVRAQEMLFASQRIAEFRDRKTKDSKVLINHLKEVWSRDQRRRIATLEEEYAHACQSIGLSHDAALLVERNKAANEELLARQAEESRYWDTLRFQEAMQKEREQKELRERGDSASALRRKIVESVSSIERSFARRYNHGANPKPQEKKAYGCSQTVNPPVTHEVTQEKVYSKLAGFPIDFKDTYLHSRFDVLQDRTNRPSSAVVNCPEQEGIDAWRAAEQQRESNRCERARQIELERLYNERKLERGTAAAAKLLNDQRISLLEQEVEEAFREEEREQDRLYAATNSGTCKRATSAGQQRRPVYTKHNVSKPLSCPGSVITQSSENLQERILESQTGVQKKPKSLQDHPVTDTERQDLSKIDIQGTKIQLVNLVSYQAEQSATVQKEGERELSAQSEVRLSNRKSDDGRLINSSQQQSSIDGPDSILEPEVAKSISHSPVQTKRKGIPHIRASCERSELNTAQTEEGNVTEQPRLKSPYKCPMPKQNADGSDRTGKRQFDVSKRGADYIAGPGRRWKSREREREKESWIKHLSDKASPGKTRYHMELVQEAAEVEKEAEQFFKGVHHKRPMCSASAIAASTHQVAHDNGETQRSQRDPSNGTRPPFISSGTVGYKKILPAPLMARCSRPTCESEGNKEAATNEDNVSLTRNVRENLKALSNAQRGADAEIGLGKLEANAHASSLRDRHRPSSGTRPSSLPNINKQGVETSRSWAHPVRSHTGPVNLQEQRKALKTVNGAKWANYEDQLNDEQELGKDSDPQSVIRDSSFPRNRNKSVRSGVETWNCLADSNPGTELIFEISKPREDNCFRKGNGSERQEKRVQEPKPRQKAVWKSYIDEKKQAGRRNLETSTGNRSIKSEPSSPPARVDRVFTSRHKRHADDYQSQARLSQPVINPNTRNCHTPAASVKSLPNSSRSKFIRDKSVPRSWKYPQANPKGIELEALENISTKMKSLSSRFHSPMTKVPQEVSPRRRNPKDLNFKKTNGFSTETLTRTEESRKLEDIRSSCEAKASNLNENFAEDGSTRTEVGSKSASNVADTLITAWKTGKFQEDYAKAMKRAKEITSGSCSSGVSKIFSDRNYRKPWLSKSPFRRIQDQEMDDVSLDKHRQNERSGSANPRTNHKSPRTCTRIKPWLSKSPSRRSPDRMMDDEENHRQYLRTDSVNLKKNNKSPMARSYAAPMTSPKRTNRSSQSQLGPQISKSSPVKSRVGKKETTNDPWEGQSLDFVLGSLAEQVRELDERIRSATMSSPALSSASSLNGESHVHRDKQTRNQPTSRLQDKLHKGRGSSSTCSAASSPERCLHEINRGPPAARNISRACTNANTQDRTAGKSAIGGTYMDELKTLLREISIDNPSPLRRHRVTSSPVTGNVDRDIKPHTVQNIAKKTELLCSMNKSGALRANAKAELEADFVSVSATDSSRACSVTSRRDTHETRVVMVENGRAPVVGNDMVSGNGQLDRGLVHERYYGNGNANAKGERERDSDPNISRTFELRDVRETKTFERRNVPQENSLREDNGVRRVLEKRLVQSRWTERQAAEYSSRSVQDTVEKRTVEIRSCAPRQVIHSGQAVIREQLVKEVVENGLPSPELHGHGCFRKNVVTPIRDRNNHNDANGRVTPVRRKRDAQESYVLQHGLPNDKPTHNENAERSYAERQRRPAAAHVAGNGHKLTMNDPRRRPMQQMEAQTREYALSNGTEDLRHRQPELPLWGEGSPHCSGSWKKGGMNSDAAEDRMLLSGSVDFSPWNTAKLPDIGTPQTVSEKRSRSKPPSPVAEEVGNGNLSPKLQRFKPPPQLIKAVGQRPIRKDALPNGDYIFHSNTAPVRESSPAKTNSLKSQTRQNLKRPKPVPRGVDALWSLNDQDTALKPSAIQNGGPPTRKRSPYEASPVKNKRRPASVPKSRLIKEQASSQEEMPDSLSKSSQDDNYLPVIMAKDPESRQRVIERRRKALQLDMEHRQRLRNSRPSSARNSL